MNRMPLAIKAACWASAQMRRVSVIEALDHHRNDPAGQTRQWQSTCSAYVLLSLAQAAAVLRMS